MKGLENEKLRKGLELELKSLWPEVFSLWKASSESRKIDKHNKLINYLKLIKTEWYFPVFIRYFAHTKLFWCIFIIQADDDFGFPFGEKAIE